MSEKAGVWTSGHTNWLHVNRIARSNLHSHVCQEIIAWTRVHATMNMLRHKTRGAQRVDLNPRELDAT